MNAAEAVRDADRRGGDVLFVRRQGDRCPPWETRRGEEREQELDRVLGGIAAPHASRLARDDSVEGSLTPVGEVRDTAKHEKGDVPVVLLHGASCPGPFHLDDGPLPVVAEQPAGKGGVGD